MKNENDYENENINLCECYDFTETVPKSFENECKKYWLDKWKEICKPQFLPDCFYLKDTDGKLYLVCDGELIEVSEHFADKGKTIDQLIEEFIIYQAKQM
ncbi:MAG: hypothetical protein U0L11_01205 [Acutalibacteraceae bacterium]|nr:hypothetical protein [Acutalibacteraceae bacterium]